jgi:hypothetical protein
MCESALTGLVVNQSKCQGTFCPPNLSQPETYEVEQHSAGRWLLGVVFHISDSLNTQKVPPKHAMETEGYRGIAKLILNLSAGWGWVVNTMSQQLYPQEQAQVPTAQGGGWV